MRLNIIFIVTCLFIWLLGYGIYRLWQSETITYNNKIIFTILIFIKLVLIGSIVISVKSINLNNAKLAPVGSKGERGLRGDTGKHADCSNKCSNNLCYQIMLDYVTEQYNDWRFTNGFEKIPEGKHISNKFLKNKINQLCSSKNYKKLLSRDGAEKIDTFIKNTWKKWLNVILKYENGRKFIDSIDLVDSDFDSMITEKDKKFASFENQGADGTPSRGLESPFDELKKYDLWYWGSNPLLKPKVINICNKKTGMDTSPELKVKESNDYYSAIWESKNSRQLHYQRWRRQIICIPAGIVPICFPICVKDGKHFVSGLQKGDTHITAYKNKDYVDKSDKSRYKPVGDIILPGSRANHSKGNTECKPGKKNNMTDKCYNNKVFGDPAQSNILVSGNVKNPVGYKPLYINLRKSGYNANNQGIQFWRPIPPPGYKCLGDIAVNNSNNSPPSTDLINCVPDRCVRKNKNYKRIYSTRTSPRDRCRSSRMCCALESAGRNPDIDHLKQYGEADIYVNKTNNFRAKDPKFQDANGQFYEIIPKGETGDSGQQSCLEERIVNKGDTNIKSNKGGNTCNNLDMDDSDYSHNNDNWIVSEKKDKKYSILNVYDN